MQPDRGSGCGYVEQGQQCIVTHAYAAMRCRHPHRFIRRCAVQVNIAALRVTVASAVVTRLQAAEPEDTRQYPIAFRERLGQCRRIAFPCRASSTIHRAGGKATAYRGTYIVPTQGRLTTPLLLSRAGLTCRNRVFADPTLTLPDEQRLPWDVNFNPHIIAGRQVDQSRCLHGSTRRR